MNDNTHCPRARGQSREGVDDAALAQRLQCAGVLSFATSWDATMTGLREKCTPAAARVQP